MIARVTCDIKSLTQEELTAQFQAWNEPGYRVAQVLHWLYRNWITSWDGMTNLPAALRERLAQHYSLLSLGLVEKQGSGDATQKFLWRLRDGALIESVLIPASPALFGEPSDRHTLCVSTQVGCAYGCKFCASGLDGWKRNLTADEIVEQVLAIERWHATERESEKSVGGSTGYQPPSGDSPDGTAAASQPHPDRGFSARATPIPVGGSPTGAGGSPALPILKTGSRNLTAQASDGGSNEALSGAPKKGAPSSSSRLINNLVIMGMGEPLANYENLLKALKILNASWGCGIGARKITISTSGLVPQIRRLAEEPFQFRLAISLHGATDEVRNRIMPVNRKYPLRLLTEACEYYREKNGRMITLEYILIGGINDGLEQAKPLAELAHRLKAKVNLIPYNPVDGLRWQRPEEPAQDQFLEALTRLKVPATLRREKGRDIDAACGQLRLKTERALTASAENPAGLSRTA